MYIIAVALIKYVATVLLPLTHIFQVSTTTNAQKYNYLGVNNTMNFSMEFFLFRLQWKQEHCPLKPTPYCHLNVFWHWIGMTIGFGIPVWVQPYV